MARHETFLLGTGTNGEVIVSVQPSAIPNGTGEFALYALSEVYPSDGQIDTVSDCIESGKVLHLLAARASVQPTDNYGEIQLYWRETVDNEDIYHLVGSTFLNKYNLECEFEFPSISMTLTGVAMEGDTSKDTRFVIRRTAYGSEDPMIVFAMARGYIETLPE